MYFDETHEAFRASLRKFVDNEINPYIDEWEETTAPLHMLFKKMGDLGFLGIRYDPAYGGQGLDYWFETVLLEEIGRIKGLGVATAIAVQTNMATPAIAEFGSTQADFLTLLARTSDEPGYHSFGLFVVPTKLPGFNVSKKLSKLGLHSSDTAELFFDDMKIPAENLIGEEREGFIYQMKQFQHERFAVLPGIHVCVREMVDATADYLRQRVVFGKPLITKQVLRHRLAGWLMRNEALKQLTYHIVRLKTAGLDVTREVSMAKVLAGQLVAEVASGCMQMYGGIGFMNETLISRYYRDSRIMSIGAGADEVMYEVVARLEGF